MIITQRYINVSTDEVYRRKMIVLLKRMIEIMVQWQEKIQKMIDSIQFGQKSFKNKLRIKLFQISCTCALSYCFDLEYFSSIFSNNDDFITYIKSLNHVRTLITTDQKKLTPFEQLLISSVDRNCLELEESIKKFVSERNGWPLMEYIKSTFLLNEEPENFSFNYSSDQYGFLVDFLDQSNKKTQFLIGLDGRFLVDGQGYSRLPDNILENTLYTSYFEQATFPVYSNNNVYETAKRICIGSASFKFEFKINDFEGKKNNFLLVKETMKDEYSSNVSILLPSDYFLEILPIYFVQNFSHWFNINSLSVEFREKTFEKFDFNQPAKFLLDTRSKIMFQVKTNRMVVMMNKPFFDNAWKEIFHRFEEKQFTHIFYDQHEKNIYFEFPRHSLKFYKKPTSNDIFSKEYSGYKISNSQNIKTLFGLKIGLVLKPIEKQNYLKKKLIIPNTSLKITSSQIHHSILHNFSELNSPSCFSYELDKRLQIIKGENSIESWLYLAYLHAITSSILPDPFLGRQGTVRSLEILQSGHCFSCSPLSEESKRILALIAALSPQREKITLKNHKILKNTWPEGLLSQAASDLFILISSEILQNSSRLSFLYEKSQKEDKLKNNSFSDFCTINKDLYLSSYQREIQEDYKLTSLFQKTVLVKKDQSVTKQSLFFAQVFDWSSDNVINVRKISTESYSPSKNFDLFEYFQGIIEFKGLSDKLIDYTKIENIVEVAKDLINHWINLYHFVQFQPFTSSLITLTGLAYLGVDFDHLLLLQKVSHFPELTQGVEIKFYSNYSMIDEFQYKEERIIEILNKFIKITPEDNPLQIKMNLGENQNQFIARIYFPGYQKIEGIVKNSEKVIRRQWPCQQINFEDDNFYIENLKKSVKKQFLDWLKHLQLKNLLEFLTHNQKMFRYPCKNVKIDEDSHNLSLEVEKKQFSIEFESYLSENLIQNSSFREGLDIYSNGLNINEELISIDEEDFSPEIFEFPFEVSESGKSLNNYFVSDLKKSWDHHISTLKSERRFKPAKHLELELHCLAAEYKSKSMRFLDIFKSSAIPSDLKYLRDSFILPSFSSSNILSMLRDQHDRKHDSLKNSDSTINQVNPIEVICGTICVFWSLEQRIQRCQYYNSQTPSQDQSLQRELETIPYSNWYPKDYPLWLILQVETDMMIRSTQVEVAKSMISPSTSKNTVMQLNMGEGKTSLIIPMVILELANKSHLVRLTVLKSLFNSNKTALISKLGGSLNRRVYSIPCKRDIKFDLPSTSLISQVLKECKSSQSVFLVLPDQRLSFFLKGLELIRSSQTSEIGSQLLQIQSRLDENSRDLLDESDEILNPRYQLIYTVGKQKNVQCGDLRWKVSQAILECMEGHLKDLFDRYQDSMIFERFSSPQRFPMIRLLNDEPYHELCRLIGRSLLWGEGRGVSFPELNSQESFDLVFSYVISENVNSKKIEKVFQLFKDSPRQLEIIFLLKGILSCNILLHCLGKRWRVNYGVNTLKMYLMQAVPFSAKDIPADKSQFAHPDIMILLTQLSYFYSGLTDKQLDQVFDQLRQDQDGSCEFESWIEELLPLVHVDFSVRTFQGINLNDDNQKEMVLYPLLRFNQRTVNYWLNHFLYPKEAKQFEGKFCLSFWDLCSQKNFPMTGFSGTNDSKILLPLTVDYFQVPRLVGTNGELVYQLLRPENGRYSHFKGNISGIELIQHVAEQEPKINVLLDVGALMMELTNFQVVVEWLKIRHDAKAGVFFDEFNNLKVLTRDGVVVDFEVSPLRYWLDSCLVYLDDSHTRGTDLKIPKGTVAAVTLGKGVNKDKLMQGCMRMRMLGKGHSVMFFASSEVHNSLKSTSKAVPSPIDILKWSLENTITQTIDNFLYWGLQGISYFRRQVLYEKYFKSKSFKNYSKYSEESDLPDIKLLYGRNRKETAIPSIINSKSLIIENTLKSFSVNLNLFRSLCQSLVSHSSHFVSSEKKFAHLLDEEQELELEIEVEVEAKIKKLPKVLIKPEKNSFEKDLKKWFENGKFPLRSLVFHQIFKGLGITSVKRKSQPLAWSPKVWITLDFMRTVSVTSQGDRYLKPVRWIGFSGTEEKPENLVVLSAFEANILIRDYPESPVKLFWYCPRSRTSQVNLFNVDNLKISLDLIQNINVFAGNQYFAWQCEVEEFLKFVGYCPTPRKLTDQNFYSKGMIRNNGFVEPEFREQVFEDNNRCNFDDDPAELVLKIIDIRNFKKSTSFGHVVDILVHGRRPFLISS